MARKIDVDTGMRLLAAARSERELTKVELRTASRFALEEFAERHPGHSVEIRVPFAGAVQAIEGPAHRRGTPPNVVELSAVTWVALAAGAMTWEDALRGGLVDASGIRADLHPYLPLFSEAALERWR